MKNNIGMGDRRARIVVGLSVGLTGIAILGDVLALGTMAGAALSLVGFVLVGTGLVRLCPLYRLLGIDTASP